MSTILVINSGSSSIKYQLIDGETRLASGLIERIGESGSVGHLVHRSGEVTIEHQGNVADHTAGFELLVSAFSEAGSPLAAMNVVAVGHRVVQGGSEFVEPTLIDDAVAARILELAALAPLHNPGHYEAIVAARKVFPNVPHVAVFDTSFHQSMPPHAYTYAIDSETARRHGIRRYGFHGISHQVVSRRAAEFLERPVESLKQIVLHLGNGASATAIDAGRSVDTSMGLTPLEGLVMGTRGGDIDPGVLLALTRQGFDADDIDRLLNHRSGLLGLAGSNDMRDVRAQAEAGGHDARLALDVYVHRIRKYIGSYLAVLGGADALVFTAGVGENSAPTRAEVCDGLAWCGIEIDHARNTAPGTGSRRISTDGSHVDVLVIPTDEELEIAHQTRLLVERLGRR